MACTTVDVQALGEVRLSDTFLLHMARCLGPGFEHRSPCSPAPDEPFPQLAGHLRNRRPFNAPQLTRPLTDSPRNARNTESRLLCVEPVSLRRNGLPPPFAGQIRLESQLQLAPRRWKTHQDTRVSSAGW